MEPTKEQIQDLRKQFLQKLDNEDSLQTEFHQADIARVKNNDDWLRRFLLHHDLDAKEALKMLWETCEWRQSFGANEINENNVEPLFKQEGGMFARNRDKDGKMLMIFRCKLHVKGQHDANELKRYVVYWFERLERKTKGDQISLFFDMSECGLSNMDMDFTKYLIGLMKSYYPYFLNYIIVYEMAWVLNAAFKIIKSWLPAKAVEKIKFVTKSNLGDYVNPDQAFVSWGGTDDYEYSFPSEYSARMEDGRKKVHFAESPSSSSTSDLNSKEGLMLSISPTDIINFVMESGEYTGALTVSNVSTKNVTFKIKTTSPEKFRVRPSMGVLAPQTSSTINVLLQPGYQVSSLSRDKFLVMALPITDMNAEIVDLWKGGGSSGAIEQHRLRCSVEGNSNGDVTSTYDSPGAAPDVNKQLSDLARQVSRLVQGQHQLEHNLGRSRTLQYLTLGTLLVLIAFVWFSITYKEAQKIIYSSPADECIGDL